MINHVNNLGFSKQIISTSILYLFQSIKKLVFRFTIFNYTNDDLPKDESPCLDLPYAWQYSHFVDTCSSCSFEQDHQQEAKVQEEEPKQFHHEEFERLLHVLLPEYPAPNENQASNGRQSFVDELEIVAEGMCSQDRCCKSTDCAENCAPKNRFYFLGSY